VNIDDGSWKKAALDQATTKHPWKLFSYNRSGAKPGEQTIVSVVIGEEGNVPPTLEQRTFLEDNAQSPCKGATSVSAAERLASRRILLGRAGDTGGVEIRRESSGELRV
jgi:hypothetical protein